VLGNELRPDRWLAAKSDAERDASLLRESPERFAGIELDTTRRAELAVWGHGSLAELYLLLLAFPKDLPNNCSLPSPDTAQLEAEKQIRAILKHVPPGGFPIRSTRRQLERYCNWWWSPKFRPGETNVENAPLLAAAKVLLAHLGERDPHPLRPTSGA
jgi:hypothetical protein